MSLLLCKVIDTHSARHVVPVEMVAKVGKPDGVLKEVVNGAGGYFGTKYELL